MRFNRSRPHISANKLHICSCMHRRPVRIKAVVIKPLLYVGNADEIRAVAGYTSAQNACLVAWPRRQVMYLGLPGSWKDEKGNEGVLASFNQLVADAFRESLGRGC
jgi:hypothetical protein